MNQDNGAPETWGLDATALQLAVNRTVAVDRDLAGRAVRARRTDVFDQMARRGRLRPEAVNAVRRLQADLEHMHRRSGGVASWAPKVDRSSAPTEPCDSHLAAGRRVAKVMAASGGSSARLLLALCEAQIATSSASVWRSIAVRETGETLPDSQTAVLRMACENLAEAYRALDRGRSGPMAD